MSIRTFKLFSLPALTILLSIMFAFSGEVSSSPEELCRNYVLKQIDSLLLELDKSKRTLGKNTNSEKNKLLLQKEYRLARKHYKKIEFFVEYYSTFDAKYYINGPLVPKHEIEFGPKIYEPMGFQVMEECLFGKELNGEDLKKQIDLLVEKFKQLKSYYSTITIEKANYLESLRLQIIRMICITFNGYDCTINKETVAENIYALESLATHVELILNYTNNANYTSTIKLLNESVNYLQQHTDSDSLNRLYFITRYLNPIYKSISELFQDFSINPSLVNYAVNLNKKNEFGVSSINKQHFSLYRYDTINITRQSSLGQLLFFDPILSGNNKRACASCHKPELAFTDGLPKSISFDQDHFITRNSPTLINALYQKLFFYDGRVFYLEEQAGEVFLNKEEMNSTEQDIVNKLKTSREYKILFQKAFSGTMDSSITFYAVMKSIAEYIKTLESQNSRFDKYLKGDYSQLTSNEINGFNLFNGKALCGSCHFFPLFNGLVPPFFNDNEFEVIGTPATKENKMIDGDIGRETISGQAIHKRAFKTPTLRNIELTAPYMHNGVFETLDEVLEFYNKGGGEGFKINVGNQTLPFDSLGLSKNELTDIKLFLLSLTDTVGLNRKPATLPKFNNVVYDARKIGGEY